MTEKKWIFRDGAIVKCKEPATVGKALETIQRKRGKLTPRAVWEESRDRRAPLHAEFTWDDKKAGVLWRDEQARCILRSVRIELPSGESTRGFVNVKMGGKSIYASAEEVIKAPELRAQVLAEIEADLESVRRKLAEWEEFAAAVVAVDLALASIKSPRVRVSRAAAEPAGVPA